ncbi:MULTISPECIES: ComF family protein [unclassified Paenibacillus]|uniref:ComF family protein n=1 Tax=unclassified Paenibacillus TaxID=185978 RepID=UPI003637D77D
MKEWLGLYKYRGHEGIRQLIGSMLIHAYNLHKQEYPLDTTTDCSEYITYVPLSDKRLSERGFNQSQQLAEELGRKTGLPVIQLLQRMRHTDKQSFKTRGGRLEDLQGVFAVAPSDKDKHQALFTSSKVTLYVVDDVYTTGSTLNECSKAIKKEFHSVDICGISWAR